MKVRQLEFPCIFKVSYSGINLREFIKNVVLFWCSSFLENGSSRYFHLAFLPLLVFREDQRNNVEIFLVVYFISLPIMHLVTGQITTRLVRGSSELTETTLGKNSISHLTTTNPHFH